MITPLIIGTVCPLLTDIPDFDSQNANSSIFHTFQTEKVLDSRFFKHKNQTVIISWGIRLDAWFFRRCYFEPYSAATTMSALSASCPTAKWRTFFLTSAYDHTKKVYLVFFTLSHGHFSTLLVLCLLDSRLVSPRMPDPRYNQKKTIQMTGRNT